MDKIATENLFLLEFLVDSLNLNKKCSCDAPPNEMCVSFQFLDNAPLDICEADFCPNQNYTGIESEYIKSGKSCLFSLTPEQAKEAIKKFDVFVNVFQKMKPGWLPEKVDIGCTLISVSNLFADLIESVSFSEGIQPTAKTLKDVFDIQDNTNQKVGAISVYIRMSCFGKLIVTQFQMNLDDKSVLFKDKEGKSLYRYKKANKNKRKSSVNGAASSTGSPTDKSQVGVDCPNKPCGRNVKSQESKEPPEHPCPSGVCPPGICPKQNKKHNQNGSMMRHSIQQDMQGPASVPMAMPNPTVMAAGHPGMLPGMGMMGGGMMGHPMMPPPSPPPFAMNNTMHPPMMSPCQECGGLTDADCVQQFSQGPPEPEGNYEEIGATMGNNTLKIRVHRDNEVQRVEDSGYQENNYAIRPGVKQGNQVMPFNFKMGKAGAGSGGNVIVNPPVCTSPDGTQFTEFSDPDKEMFILRIGKKSEGVEKKQNLELELLTPKGPDLKPRPKKETRETQYDPNDCGEEEPSKGKAGKGDKKGKKGGKGGKKGGKKGKGKKGKKK